MCRHLFRPRAFSVGCVYAPLFATLPYIYRLWFFVFCFLHSSRAQMYKYALARAHARYGRMWTSEKNGRALSEHNYSNNNHLYLCSVYEAFYVNSLPIMSLIVSSLLIFLNVLLSRTHGYSLLRATQIQTDLSSSASNTTRRRRLERNNYMFGGREGISCI